MFCSIRTTACGSFTADVRDRDAQRLNVLRPREAGVDVPKGLERANHQSRADEQDQREGDLNDDKHAARAMAVATLADRSAAGAKRRPELRARRTSEPGSSRRATLDSSDDDRREHEDGATDRDLVDARQVGGRHRLEHRSAPYASASATTPPMPPSVRLSSSSSRAIRLQPAPSAARIASSCCRPSARTSSRFATFAHAISRTMPTVPMRTHSTSVRSPTQALLQRLHERTEPSLRRTSWR